MIQNNDNFTLKAVIETYNIPQNIAEVSPNNLPEPTVTTQIITDYKNGHSSPFATYDEHVTLNRNDQNELSFSMCLKYNNQINPLLSLMTVGRELQLFWENNFYYFVITSRKPKFLKDNIEFNFRCQDSFSYYLSKNNIGASFTDEDNLDVNTLHYTNKNAKELLTEIMRNSHIFNKWKVDSTLCSKKKGLASFPQIIYGTTVTSEESKASLDLTDSNTFNALIEVSNIFNGSLVVKYNKNPAGPHIFTLRNNTYPQVTYHRLRADLNLNNFDLNETGEDFCTIMNIHGGEAANGSYVSLIPTVPSDIVTMYGYLFNDPSLTSQLSDILGAAQDRDLYKRECVDKFGAPEVSLNTIEDTNFCAIINSQVPTASSMLYNFDYFVKTRQMTPETLSMIKRILNFNYRNANLKLLIASDSYYNLLNQYNSLNDQEEEIISMLAATSDEKINAFLDNTNNDNVAVVTDASGKMSVTKDDTVFNYSTVNKIDYINNNITNLLFNLFNLWNTNYVEVMTQMGVMENTNTLDFIETKISKYSEELEKVIEEYKRKYAALQNIIKDTTVPKIEQNHNYITYTHIEPSENNNQIIQRLKETNLSLYTEYATLKQELKKLSIKIDKRYIYNADNCKVRGYYGYYIDMMRILKTIKNATVNENNTEFSNDTFIIDDIIIYSNINPLLSIYNAFTEIPNQGINYLKMLKDAKKEKEQIWEALLTNYGHFFIEANFSDETQIDSNSLFIKANAQFLKYSNPVITYSASMLDWDCILDDHVIPPHIGDSLVLQYNNLNIFNILDTTSKRLVRFTVSEPIYAIQSINDIKLTDVQNFLISDAEHEEGSNSTVNIKSNTLLPANTKMRIVNTYNESKGFIIDILFTVSKNTAPLLDYSFIQYINGVKVLNHEVVMNDTDVSLVITGIDKDLRSNSTKLTVSNELNMNIIIQKMLLNVRY